MKPVIKHYLVEVNFPAPAVGQRVYLGDIPELRHVITEQMESYYNGILAVSPSQQTLVSQAAAANFIVTLCEDSTETIYQIPYLSLCKSINGGSVTEYSNKKFNLPKSYITLLDTAGVAAGNSVVLSFYYR